MVNVNQFLREGYSSETGQLRLKFDEISVYDFPNNPVIAVGGNVKEKITNNIRLICTFTILPIKHESIAPYHNYLRQISENLNKIFERKDLDIKISNFTKAIWDSWYLYDIAQMDVFIGLESKSTKEEAMVEIKHALKCEGIPYKG